MVGRRGDDALPVIVRIADADDVAPQLNKKGEEPRVSERARAFHQLYAAERIEGQRDFYARRAEEYGAAHHQAVIVRDALLLAAAVAGVVVVKEAPQPPPPPATGGDPPTAAAGGDARPGATSGKC